MLGDRLFYSIFIKSVICQSVSLTFLFLYIFLVGHDVREIQRQNRITQQIITNYLERKLFPNRRPQHQAPSVDEIIQIPGISEETKTLLIAKGGKDKDDDTDPETLQSVGSENIDNILDTPSNTYRGKFGFGLGFFFLYI